jgi:hypothetical protein
MLDRASLVLAAVLVLASSASAQPLPTPSGQSTAWAPNPDQERLVLKTANDYFAAQDRGDASSAYAVLGKENQALISFPEFTKRLREFNRLAGPVKDHQVIKVTWYKNPQGAPSPGTYAAIDIVSRFAKVDRHCGYMMFRQAPSGGDFQLMREETNFISNADAATIEKRQSKSEVEKAWAAISSHCPNYPRAPLEEQPGSFEYSSVAAALSALRAKPGVVMSIEDGWTIAREDPSATFWSFTPVGHPAHPAAVKRQLVDKDGGTHLQMQVHCEAEKAPCDDLVRSFQQLNDQLIQSIRKR